MKKFLSFSHHHKKVIIHVPYKIKHIHHTHTVYKHVHHNDHGHGGDHDYYKVIGYSGGIDHGTLGGGHHGQESHGWEGFGGGHGGISIGGGGGHGGISSGHGGDHGGISGGHGGSSGGHGGFSGGHGLGLSAYSEHGHHGLDGGLSGGYGGEIGGHHESISG